MNEKEIIVMAQRSFENAFGTLQSIAFEIQDGEIFMFVNDEQFYESDDFRKWSAKVFKEILMPNDSAINFAFDNSKFTITTADVNFANISTSVINTCVFEGDVVFLSSDDSLNKTIFSFTATDKTGFFDFSKAYKGVEVDCEENYNMAA